MYMVMSPDSAFTLFDVPFSGTPPPVSVSPSRLAASLSISRSLVSLLFFAYWFNVIGPPVFSAGGS